MGLMDLFKKKSSGDVAKDRLKLLLVTDRASCSPEMMEQIKNESIQEHIVEIPLIYQKQKV